MAEDILETCPICASFRVQHLGFVAPHTSVGHDRYAIVECRSCGISFSDPLPSDEDITSFYELPTAYEEIYGICDHEWRREQYRRDLLRVERSRDGRRGRLLDVGCSYGLLLGVAAELGWEVYGVEPNPRACKAARKRITSDTVWCGYVQEIPSHWGPFDAITMSHVFEHLVDFRTALRLLADRLAAGGVLAIQSPNRLALATFRLGPDYRPVEHPFYWTYRAAGLELMRTGLKPRVAPPLWRMGWLQGARQFLKEVALAVEGLTAFHLNIGIKSTLEIHGIKK